MAQFGKYYIEILPHFCIKAFFAADVLGTDSVLLSVINPKPKMDPQIVLIMFLKQRLTAVVTMTLLRAEPHHKGPGANLKK